MLPYKMKSTSKTTNTGVWNLGDWNRPKPENWLNLN